MTKQELYLILQSKTFIVRNSDIQYQFDEDTLIVNGEQMWEYELFTDDNKIYLKCKLIEILLENADSLSVIVVNTSPYVITLTGKNDTPYIILEEESIH